MANYIYSILKSQPMIIFSWGFNKPMALVNDEGLIFQVNGFKHQGQVKVIYHAGKDLFVVILLDSKNNEVLRIDEVFFDQLVEVIDNAVELVDDYDNRVNEFYSK